MGECWPTDDSHQYPGDSYAGGAPYAGEDPYVDAGEVSYTPYVGFLYVGTGVSYYVGTGVSYVAAA